VKFLIDRCAGHRLAVWLLEEGHDVFESSELGPDPGDRALLRLAAEENRILVTLDKDFGEIIYLERAPHRGMIRLPDVPSDERKRLVRVVLESHSEDLEKGALITVRGGRMRVSRAEEEQGGRESD